MTLLVKERTGSGMTGRWSAERSETAGRFDGGRMSKLVGRREFGELRQAGGSRFDEICKPDVLPGVGAGENSPTRRASVSRLRKLEKSSWWWVHWRALLGAINFSFLRRLLSRGSYADQLRFSNR